MIGGMRYDIQLDYYENTSYARVPALLVQPQPAEADHPGRAALSLERRRWRPPAHISPTDATALVGGPFSLCRRGQQWRRP